MKPDFFNIAAKKKMGNVEGWQWYRIEAIRDNFFLVEGGIPIGEISRGPNKGRKKWAKGNGDKVLITREEIDQAQSEYETQTGNCSYCGGEGKHVTGWNKDTGNKYITCPSCNGTGKTAGADKPEPQP